MSYVEKREGRATVFVGEAPKLKKKRRFKTERDAKDYEAFCKLMGREPPTVLDGQLESTGSPTFAQVTEMARKAGGPKGKWNAGRDRSLPQRLEWNVGIIGAYEIQRVTRSVLKQITASLERAKAPGKSHLNSLATKNRYLSAASAVLRYALQEELIETKPSIPWLDEKETRKARDILQKGQEHIICKIMRDEGHALEALCVDFLLETGLRAGELQKLTPGQIRMEQVEDDEGTSVLVGVVYLNKGQTKNNTFRPVILSVELAKEIRAVIAGGKLPKADKVLSIFKSACESAGYTGNLVIHSLRHTRNTRLFKAGVDKDQRKEMIGHLSDEANEIYTHRDLTDQLRAVKKVEKWAGEKRENTSATLQSIGKIA